MKIERPLAAGLGALILGCVALGRSSSTSSDSARQSPG